MCVCVYTAAPPHTAPTAVLRQTGWREALSWQREGRKYRAGRVAAGHEKDSHREDSRKPRWQPSGLTYLCHSTPNSIDQVAFRTRSTFLPRNQDWGKTSSLLLYNIYIYIYYIYNIYNNILKIYLYIFFFLLRPNFSLKERPSFIPRLKRLTG